MEECLFVEIPWISRWPWQAQAALKLDRHAGTKLSAAALGQIGQQLLAERPALQSPRIKEYLGAPSILLERGGHDAAHDSIGILKPQQLFRGVGAKIAAAMKED